MPRTLPPGRVEVVSETSLFGRDATTDLRQARHTGCGPTKTKSRRFGDDLLGLATDDGDLDSRSQPLRKEPK